MANMQNDNPGCMIISLDFELLWGRLDTQTIDSYGENILGGRTAVNEMLALFEKYGIHATWGIVGYMYAHSMEELRTLLPEKKANYANTIYDPYLKFEKIESEDPAYYFAPELIEKIRMTEGQEIGTHTFSHYYCLEQGQDSESFAQDLKKATEVETNRIESIIFPRNQSNPEYVSVLREAGIRSYRGNPKAWCYKAANKKQDRSLLRRAGRLLDMYIPICGHQCADYAVEEGGIYNMPASRFLRPYSSKLKCLEGLRLRRIKKQMDYAAKHGKMFHIWWHPHNFGKNLAENLSVLESILLHYQKLNAQYGFRSCTMKEVREYCDENSNTR